MLEITIAYTLTKLFVFAIVSLLCTASIIAGSYISPVVLIDYVYACAYCTGGAVN